MVPNVKPGESDSDGTRLASAQRNLLWPGNKKSKSFEVSVKFLNGIPSTWTYRSGGLNFDSIMSWAS